MIPVVELDLIAQARLEDARALFAAQRPDGASYLCGYAVEVALKARVCRQLNWAEFPRASKEFGPYRSFQTHDLDILLRLSGQEARIKELHFLEWNVVARWNPESRYENVGTASLPSAGDMIDSANVLMGVI